MKYVNIEICPDCCEKLIKDSKKLGNLSVWLICPKCGFRKRPFSDWEEMKQITEFEVNKSRVNANNNEAFNDI